MAFNVDLSSKRKKKSKHRSSKTKTHWNRKLSSKYSTNLNDKLWWKIFAINITKVNYKKNNYYLLSIQYQELLKNHLFDSTFLSLLIYEFRNGESFRETN